MSAWRFIVGCALLGGGLAIGVLTAPPDPPRATVEGVEEAQEITPAPAIDALDVESAHRQPETGEPRQARLLPERRILAGQLTPTASQAYMVARHDLFTEFDRLLDYRRLVDARLIRPLGLRTDATQWGGMPLLYEGSVSLLRRLSRANRPHGDAWDHGRFMLLGLRIGEQFTAVIGDRSDGGRMHPHLLADLMLGYPGARVKDRASTLSALRELAMQRSVATELLTRRLWHLLTAATDSQRGAPESVVALYSDALGPACLVRSGSIPEIDHRLSDILALDHTLARRVREYFP